MYITARPGSDAALQRPMAAPQGIASNGVLPNPATSVSLVSATTVDDLIAAWTLWQKAGGLSDKGQNRCDTPTRRGAKGLRRSTEDRLAAYQASYRHLTEQLAGIGYIAAGSVIQRHTRCANPNCRCHADPPQMHGPYWQWTAKIGGKTATRRLTDREARLYQWIANDRQLRTIIQQMRHVAAKATELIMKQPQDDHAKV